MMEDKQMKKYMYIAAFAAAIFATACSKDAQAPESAPAGTVFTATLTPLSKASIDPGKVMVLWNPGDRICVNGAVSNALTETASSAVFSFEATLAAPYRAIYPAELYKDASNITLPGEYGADGLNLALAAFSDKGSNLRFSALTALLQVSVKAGKTPGTLKEIVIEGLGKEQLSGDFAINYSGKSLSGKSTAAADRQVKINVNKALSDDATVIYIPIPAGEYPSGYQVDFIDSEDKIMRQTVSARTLKAGELRVMPELAFNPNYNPTPVTVLGGIPDVAELKAFAAAVNDGESLERWLNKDGEVELLADIDLSGETWTPIGNVSSTGNEATATAPGGNVFEAVFDGKGHTVSGFGGSVSLKAGETYGLFGYVRNATIKNLNLVSDGLTIDTAGEADAGILAGSVNGSTVQNVKVSGSLNLGGISIDNKRFSVGAIAGYVFSTPGHNTLIKDCEVNLTVSASGGKNTKNGSTGCHYGGIAGFSTTGKDDSRISIENCSSSGTITSSIGRSSGIVAAANYGTIIKECTNNADQLSSMANGRIANIACVLGGASEIIDCVNNGDITTVKTDCQAGGFVALLNSDDCCIKGGANHGTIISAFVTDSSGRDFYGLLVANFSKFAEVSGVAVGGHLGKYSEDGNHQMIALSAENYIESKYIGYYKDDAAKSKIKNLTFVAE